MNPMLIKQKLQSKTGRWNQILRKGWEVYLNEGITEVLKTAPPFAGAVIFNSYLRNTHSRQDFIDSDDLLRFDIPHAWLSQNDDEAEITLKPPDQANFETRWKTGPEKFSPTYVSELRDVVLIGPDALRTLEDGRFLIEDPYDAMGDKRIYTSIIRLLKQNGRNSKSQLSAILEPSNSDFDAVEPGPVFSLVGFPQSFYHWIIEFLPRIKYLRQYRRETGKNPTILIPERPPQYIIESLELLGIDTDTCHPWKGGVKKFERFVYTSNPRNPNGLPHIVACHWLRNEMRSNVEIDEADSESRNIYISREDADARRVINEDALLSVLSAYGFEKVVLSELSLKDQIQLFATADTVLAPHGAGIVNIIYGINIDVIELFGKNIQQHYYNLSNLMGHNYNCLKCMPENQIDIVVDTAEVESCLDEVLTASE
ncbi:glycosyltransferase family 61 protein [Haloarchaeobius amylolyticus]|uniref:Glycosyltransferase family 61 protein n=1 Tax=Haloarchaeobius amylolyticus TaxID=1198296 RepID=A0ABD6BDX5_9EURY